MFALLTGRSSSIYKEMLQQLEEEAERLQMDFVPNQITTDFEKALVKPLREQVGKIFKILFAHYLVSSFLELVTPAAFSTFVKPFTERFENLV